jgi:hypothetical protein
MKKNASCCGGLVVVIREGERQREKYKCTNIQIEIPCLQTYLLSVSNKSNIVFAISFFEMESES